MSGLNPAGDLADLSPYLAGWYADSSGANAWQSGRIDRLPLTLPANRTLSGFFSIPDLAQVGENYTWSNVGRPGLTPNPTWALSTFRLAAVVPGDTTVTPMTAWEIWAPAAEGCLRLPILAPGAPGGLPDPAETPGHDRLMWDEILADPTGPIQEMLDDPYSRLTRWSRRSVEIQFPSVSVEEFGLGTLSGRVLRFKLVPNPGSSARDVLWDRPPHPGATASWSIWDPAGRRLLSGSFKTSGGARDERSVAGIDRLATGIYWVRIRVGDRSGSLPLLVTR
jgi:hypothetical protein